MTTTAFVDPTPVSTEPEPLILDPIGLVLADHLREVIWTGVRSSDRSRQTEAGMSEIGSTCERQLAYKLTGVPPLNLSGDPMPVIMGTGFHLHMERIFGALDPRRYLVETPLRYEGIPGTADLYDRRRRLLVDWKSTSKAKLRRIRKEGPTQRQVVQIQLYGLAIRQIGEDPQRLALAFVPRDGTLDDLYVWSTVPDPDLALQWVARYQAIAARTAQGATPGDIEPSPDRLCTFCDHYSPGSQDLSRGCPGPNN